MTKYDLKNNYKGQWRVCYPVKRLREWNAIISKNLYALNNITSKYIKLQISEKKKGTSKPTIVVKNLIHYSQIVIDQADKNK